MGYLGTVREEKTMARQLTEIERVRLHIGSYMMYRHAEEFYKDPENLKRFEDWQVARAEAARKEKKA